MHIVTSNDRQISSVIGCFDCLDWLTKRTPGPSGDKFSQPEYIFAGLGPQRISHTAQHIHLNNSS